MIDYNTLYSEAGNPNKPAKKTLRRIIKELEKRYNTKLVHKYPHSPPGHSRHYIDENQILDLLGSDPSPEIQVALLLEDDYEQI